MPQVTLSDRANISRLETPFGLIRRRTPLSVPADWALMRIKDDNLMFVFEESDREEVLKTDDKTLNVLSRVLGEELKTASSLSDLLLPKKATKKTSTKASKKTTSKKSALEE